MADEFVTQFGQTLFDCSNESDVSPSTALTGKDYVLLYFSAKWCGPCRMFTPILIEFYNKMKSTKNIELVFCSLDNDESEYKDYISKMPWLSMPFGAKESKTMARKYNADGIPHLVVVDGNTGEVITDDGTDGIRSDKEWEKFPWKPKPLAELWPSQILSSKGSEEKFLNSDTLKDKYLMLYFSAHWCPPCRVFTPVLSQAYTKLKAQRDDFELVFLSSDKDEEAFKEYFETMTFCGLPFELREEKAGMSKLFKVTGIPSLVMLGPVSEESGDRELINPNIRNFIQNEDFDEFPFFKKNYGSVSHADDIQDIKSIVVLHENGDDEEQGEIKSTVQEAATKLKENGEEVNVLWALDAKGLVLRLRTLTNLPEMSEEPAMIMLDIPDQGGYYKSSETEITVEKIMKFFAEPGDRLQLE